MFRREKKTRLLKSLQQWQKGRWTRCKRSSRHTPGINIDLARYDRNVRYQSCHCLTCQVCQVGTQGINLFPGILICYIDINFNQTTISLKKYIQGWPSVPQPPRGAGERRIWSYLIWANGGFCILVVLRDTRNLYAPVFNFPPKNCHGSKQMYV